MIDFDVIFEGARVPTWLREFERAPREAVEDLLVGRADFGLLAAEEPSTLLLDWLVGIGEQQNFAREVDDALMAWIENSWGNPTLDKANGSAALTAVAWCRAADVIAMEEGLDRSADCLKRHVAQDRRFLNALHEGRGRDPMGRTWLAVARDQRDRGLIDEWWRLCSLPPDEPWYRGAFGVHGLRGLPADRSKQGGFAEEVAEGLALLACSLWQRQNEGFLQEKTAQSEFARTARMTMAAYPFPKEWQSFWMYSTERFENQAPRDWVKKIIRLNGAARSQKNTPSPARKRSSQAKQWTQSDPQWPSLVKRIADALRRADWSVLGDAEQLLKAQTEFAEATGNTYFVVRTACNFAGKVRKRRPGLAYRWAELARHLAPWNGYAWTTSCSALLALGRHREALTLALKAIERFPENVVARTGLAEVLKADKRLDEAESVYRDTIARFPEDVFARSGLAEVLKAEKKLDEAESVYRDTIARFPENVIARSGLAEVLKADKRLDEAESVYRDTIARFPEDDFARSGLAEVLKAEKRLDEAESVYRDTIARFPEDVIARNGLAEVLKAEKKLDEAESVYRDTIARFPEDVFARNGLAEVLKAEKKLDEAESVYRDTIARFPEDVFARNGLAEVLKADKRLDEAESVYRDTIERFPEDVFARSGLAEVLKAEKKLDEAESVYRDTIERFPENVITRNGLATLLKSLGRSDEAAQLIASIGDVLEEDEALAEQREESPAESKPPAVIPKTPESIDRVPDTQIPKPSGETPKVIDDASAVNERAEDMIEPFGQTEPAQTEAMSKPLKENEPVEDVAIAPGLREQDIQIFLADAYLLRRWQRRTSQTEVDQSTASVRDRARELLDNLLPLIGRNSRAASEAGLLTLSQGDLEQAVALLLQASERFRGSVRVHYALARAQRELARVQQRDLSAKAETEVIVPWRRLSRVDEHCRPVQLLGEGRAWLTLHDGATVKEQARNAFGRLGHWLRRQIESTDREPAPHASALEQVRDRFTPREQADPFFGWWAREVQTYVFGEEEISRTEDLEDLAPICGRIVQHGNILDQIEEECVARFDRA